MSIFVLKIICLKKMKLHIYLCLIIFGLQQLYAQDDHYAVGYKNAVSNHAALYSGNEQRPFMLRLTNHQYFKKEDYASGRLSYGGVVYHDVLLRWDLYRDELIMLTPAHYHIAFKSEYVDFAEIHGYRVFYLHPDGLAGCPPAGNYILLHSGDNLLVEKVTNQIYGKANSFDRFRIEYYFTLSTTFYLQKDDAYYRIKNQKTLLKALDTHRNELKRFIRARNFNYKVDAETMVLEVVKEHEKLSR